MVRVRFGKGPFLSGAVLVRGQFGQGPFWSGAVSAGAVLVGAV